MSADRLLNGSDLATLAGSVLIVATTTNGLRQFSGVKPKPVALALSLILCVIGVVAKESRTWIDWVLVVPNGMILFTATCGAIGIATGAKKKRTKNESAGAPAEEVAQVPLFWAEW